MHPESAPLKLPRVKFFKVCSFVSCFPTMLLNRAKLKYEAMRLKAYEKFILIIELGAIYLFSFFNGT